MKTALTLTNPTPEELAGLRAALNFSSGFAVRRAQILLQVAAGKTAPTIAREMHCSHQGVRNIIRAFNARGLACLEAQSSAPKSVKPIIQEPQGERLVALLHTSPRVYNRKTSLWTLSLLAEVAAETKITPRLLTGEAIRQALVRLEISWRRAKTWITSPDPEYAAKKRRRDRLIAWACGRPDAMYGFQDEVWWSRLAAPNLHAWTPDQPLRLVEQTVAKTDPDPKAIACYGLLIQACDEQCTDQVWLRFVKGRPVSAVTTAFLKWCAERAAAQGKRFLVMVGDNASWHVSREVHTWLKQHNRQVVLSGRGCRIIPSFLPVKSPWLNPIEPKWLHAKRRIVEPDRLLTAAELRRRVVEAFDCTHEPDLIQPKKPVRSKKVA